MTFIPNVYGKLSSSNSGALATAIGVGFTGTYELVNNYSSAALSIVIGTNEQVTITINYSINIGGTVKTVETIDVTGPETHIIAIKSQYFQIIITNVTTVTSGSEIQTIFNTDSKLPTEPISRTIENSSDSVLTKSVLYGNYRNNYIPVEIESNIDGSIKSHITGPVDAFDRLRVSNNFSIFSSSNLTLNEPFKFDTLTSGSGTTSYAQGYPHVIMTVNGIGRVVRQQHGYSIYQPGKSLLILITGSILNGSAPATCTGRMGYFDEESDKNVALDDSPTGDGFFFQAVGNGTATPTMSIVYRTSNRISGTIAQIDTTIAQASWNIDPLNGSGPSGLNIDFTNRQIYMMELEWLGTGDVVLGIFYNRKPVPCHKFNFTGGEYAPNGPGGIPYPQLAYTTRGSLPVRYELESTGVGTATMYQNCSTVISEGGFEPAGIYYAGPMATRTTGGVGTENHMYALRLNSTNTSPRRPRVHLNITGINIICTSSAIINYRCYYIKANATSPVTGGTWVNGSTAAASLEYSAAEYNITATSNGPPSNATFEYRCAMSGVIFATTASSSSIDLLKKPIVLTSNISGLSDVFIVTCISTTANEDIRITVSWEEYE